MRAPTLDGRGSTAHSGLHPRLWPSWVRWPLAFVPPLIAFAFECAFYDWIAPHTWFVFFPALFLSAWLGSLRAALVANVITTAAAWWVLVPPRFTLIGHPRDLTAACTLLVMSSLTAFLIERLRQSNQQLAQTNAQIRMFAALIENSTDFIGVADLKGTPIYVNPCGRAMVGLAPDESVERTQIPDYYPPELRGFVKDVIVQGMNERGEWEGETRFRNLRTGRAIPVSDKHFLIRDPPSGRPLGFGTVKRDITEQKRLEEELHRSHERLEMALKGADLAAWDWNVETGEFVYNRRWAEIRGYEFGELPRRVESWFSEVHPDDLPGMRQALDDHFEARRPDYTADFRVATKDGRWVWLHHRGKVYARDERGKPLRMAGTSLDITREKRAQFELRFFADLGPRLGKSLHIEDELQAITDLVLGEFADWCVIDLVEDTGEVRRAKVACANPKMFAFAERFSHLPLDRKKPLMVTSVLETGTSILERNVSPELIEYWAQDEEHLEYLRAANICSIMWVALTDRERILGAIGLVSTTPDHRYGLDDLRLAEELARRASLSLENVRLYRAAERAIKDRDDVLAVVAHDLRNPLGAILMQAGMLKRREPARDSPAHRSAERIEGAVQRMNRLIQDLLDIIRVEAGRLVLERAELEPREMAKEAVDAHRALAAAASIELRLNLGEHVPNIFGDRYRLLRVFENLIGNALKFTPAGGRVTVGVVPLPEAVLFYVRDSGAGISSEDLPHVFDRFWQASRPQVGKRGDSGLGLPIVKGLVETHGGSVWVESRLGEGSTFYFTVPAAPPPEARL
jgi:PAS domain S-box-containing protein